MDIWAIFPMNYNRFIGVSIDVWLACVIPCAVEVTVFGGHQNFHLLLLVLGALNCAAM